MTDRRGLIDAELADGSEVSLTASSGGAHGSGGSRAAVWWRRIVVVLVIMAAVASGILLDRFVLTSSSSSPTPAPTPSPTPTPTPTPTPAPTPSPARRRVIHISLDGFRADYYTRHCLGDSGATLCPTLRAMAARGLRVAAMQPAFPSATYPNHYTLATGLFPESHGIVANNMYDPVTGHTFSVAHSSAENEWWEGEPIWVTAIKWNLRSGVYFWPGSEAAIKDIRPTYYLPYKESTPLAERVAGVLSWIDLPLAEQPSHVMLYFSDVDTAGHIYGPDNDQQISSAIRAVDSAIGLLVDGLQSRGLLNSTDVLVTSDHGMAGLDLQQRVLFLEDYIDLTDVRIVESGINVGLIPPPDRIDSIVQALTNKSHFTVYKKENVPFRLHYQAHRRIAPVLLFADEGWWVQSRTSPVKHDLGGHGYDNTLPHMQALALLSGPGVAAAAHGTVIPTMANRDIYGLVCYRLGIAPAPNNGSLDTLMPYLAR